MASVGNYANEDLWTNPKSTMGEAAAADYIMLPIPAVQVLAPQVVVRALDLVLEGMTNTTGHLVLLETPLGHLSVLAPGNNPESGCHRVTTQETASSHGAACVVATNAGFFDMGTGACIGNVVANGVPVQMPAGPRVNFGTTASGEYVVGYLDQEALERIDKTAGWAQLVQGAGWLVRDGQAYVAPAAVREGIPAGFVAQLAPRTLIGLDALNRTLLLEIDGNEGDKVGPDLHQTAQLALQLGFVQAINLDGGGSSTFVYNGTLCSGCGQLVQRCQTANHGDDKRLEERDGFEQAAPCQRTVTTVMCIS